MNNREFYSTCKNAQVNGQSLEHNTKPKSGADSTAINIDDNTTETKPQVSGKQNTTRMRYGCHIHHKNILCTGGLLDDIHIGAAQLNTSLKLEVFKIP